MGSWLYGLELCAYVAAEMGAQHRVAAWVAAWSYLSVLRRQCCALIYSFVCSLRAGLYHVLRSTFFSVTVSLYCDGACKIELLADKPAKRKDQGRHGGPFSRRGAAD